ncbi:hypothetical protein [Acinetobacter sp. 1000160]
MFEFFLDEIKNNEKNSHWSWFIFNCTDRLYGHAAGY